jgi:hypothetical protein
MESNKIMVVLDGAATMGELGKQFGRAYGAAPEPAFLAALSETLDAMISEMMGADIAMCRAKEVAEEFEKAAASEWKRISLAVRSTAPGRA